MVLPHAATRNTPKQTHGVGMPRLAQDLTRRTLLDQPAGAQLARLDVIPALRLLVFEHGCEACYGPPEYGGNRDLCGWRAIGYAGDVQPRGWTDDEVASA